MYSFILSRSARYLLLCAAVSLSACILPPTFQFQDPAANQQVSFVSSELEPQMIITPSTTDKAIAFHLVADDADVNDTLIAKFFRVGDDGKVVGPVSDTFTLLAVDPPTRRSIRPTVAICGIVQPATTVQLAAVVTDRSFTQLDAVVDGATSSRNNWVVTCTTP